MSRQVAGQLAQSLQSILPRCWSESSDVKSWVQEMRQPGPPGVGELEVGDSGVSQGSGGSNTHTPDNIGSTVVVVQTQSSSPSHPTLVIIHVSSGSK